MSYKTVLVHIDEAQAAQARIAVAASVALASDGHLIGTAMTGISRFLYQNAVPDQDDPNLLLHLNFLRQRASAALSGFDRQVNALGLTSFEQRVIDDEAGGGISALARCADLVVIGQFDPAQPSNPVMSDFPAYVIMHAGKPVLLLPHARLGSEKAVPGTAWPPQNVLISWNGSKEAAHAIGGAMPLLKQAGKVSIVVFDVAGQFPVAGEAPGVGIQQYLARHGVHAQILLRVTEKQSLRHANDIGEALLALADDDQADLLVMGAYGHSRFRETILGGVTRTVLQQMRLPVLMAH